MNLQAQGMRVLQQAEESLRSLINKGLEQQHYGEVATLALLAEGVASLRGAPTTPQSNAMEGASEAPMDAHVHAALKQQQPKRKPKSRSPIASRYPRFERDAGVLIKVGWSKKNSTEYEHKAPRENVEAFCRRLAVMAEGGDVFTMDDILPMRIGDDGDLPDYQAYLSLAWLRERGVVRKQGRDGYIVSNPQKLGSAFEQEWQTLPIRPGG